MSKSHFTEDQRKELITKLVTQYGHRVSKDEILDFCSKHSLPNPHFLTSRRDIKSGKDYMLDLFYEKGEEMKREDVEQTAPALQAQVMQFKPKRATVDADSTIPQKDNTYVPFGFFKQLEQILKSHIFYPVFITGLSGNGKTTMVEQVAAKLKRECIRVNISIETDEDDLIGGNTLHDGNVIYREGPVLMAMRRGAVLLIDEIDRDLIN